MVPHRSAAWHRTGPGDRTGKEKLLMIVHGAVRRPVQPNRADLCWALARPLGKACNLAVQERCIHT